MITKILKLLDHQFELLVESTECQDILGIGVMGFAPGPDGEDRDARFDGESLTVDYPSKECIAVD